MSARITKRKLDEAIDSLDQVFRDRAVGCTSSKAKAVVKGARTSTPALEALLHRSTPQPRSAWTVVHPHPPLPSDAASATAPSTYAPASVSQLLARIATYKLSTYPPPKPRRISAPALALAGWSNEGGKDRLVCVTCLRAWVVPTPSASAGGWNGQAGRVLLQKVEGMMQDEHAPGCPWKARRCRADLYGMQYTGPRAVVEDLVARARGIDGSGACDVINGGDGGGKPDRLAHNLSDDELESVRAAVTLVCSNAPPARDPESAEIARTALLSMHPTPSTYALILALFGWAHEPSRGPSTPTPTSRSGSVFGFPSRRPAGSPTFAQTKSDVVLSCPLCMRKVGSWSLAPQASPSGAPLKPFDPRGAHRDFCPWVDPLCGSPCDPPSGPPKIAASDPLAPTTAIPAPGELLKRGAKKPGWQVIKEMVVRYATPGQVTAQGQALAAKIAGDGNPREKHKAIVGYVKGVLSGL